MPAAEPGPIGVPDDPRPLSADLCWRCHPAHCDVRVNGSRVTHTAGYRRANEKITWPSRVVTDCAVVDVLCCRSAAVRHAQSSICISVVSYLQERYIQEEGIFFYIIAASDP